MDAVLLTWRWQNLFAIGVMLVFWLLAFTLVRQAIMHKTGQQQ